MEFTDERGLAWTMAEFCEHYRVDPVAATKLFDALNRPEIVNTRDFVGSCKPRAKLQCPVIVHLSGKERRVLPSVTALSKFAEEYAARNLPAHKRRRARVYAATWTTIGRPTVIDMAAFLEAAIAPKLREEKSKMIRARPLTREEVALAAIPRPTLYETMYHNDAGMFGAGEVQRSNFAGRMQGGGPIYTGR